MQQHMMLEIQVMAGVSHKNVARLNWLIGSIPLPIDSRPASTLRIHNVAVWMLFGQVPFLRENYVATTYFRYVICKSL